jgi:hypothetical protein
MVAQQQVRAGRLGKYEPGSVEADDLLTTNGEQGETLEAIKEFPFMLTLSKIHHIFSVSYRTIRAGKVSDENAGFDQAQSSP